MTYCHREIEFGGCAGYLSRLAVGREFAIRTIVVLAVAFVPGAARAVDAKQEPGLITDTIANMDRRATYDNASTYGAETVRAQAGRHVSPEGGRLGSFAILPSVSTRAGFDDNIFGSSKNAVGDMRYEVAPSVVVSSDLPRHVLNMAFGANLVRYARHSELDFNNYSAIISGGLHINNAHTLGITVSSNLSHELPGSIELPSDLGEPVPVFNHSATIGLTRDVGRLYGTVSATASRYDYQDAHTLDGRLLDQDARDMDFLSTQLRTGYRISPGFEVIGKARLLRQIHTGGDDVFNLDATGYEGAIGLSFETSPLLRWHVLGGYGIRNYDMVDIADAKVGLFEANFEWLPTQRLTIVGGVAREFVDTVGLDVAGRVDTSASARADIEIYNNMVLSIGGRVIDSEFNGLTRSDRTYAANAELQYYLNKHLVLSLDLEHSTRDSSVDEFDMDRNSIMFGAKLSY